ncbi:hypothetical protein LS684_08675 [Cytobacillus spongiae]|uniref:hypothetical protein n=1 Tax=Cytobacillus spongiae TaxID=2901381 RepID=UPI001F2A42BE|nr:hypothetical protein [Cytobacillus spongiae]UII57492.1 hypothetical protein LS684_08675 [Cytobacillus spongiae]
MPCSNTPVTIPVCLEIETNVLTGVQTQEVTCGTCTQSVSFTSPILTITTPLTYEYEVTIEDNLEATVTLINITSP